MIWRLSDSPYQLTNNLRIAEGAELSVEPGVTIVGNGLNLTVYGIFRCVGTSGQRIRILNLQVRPGPEPLAQTHLVECRFCYVQGGCIYGPGSGGSGSGYVTLEDTLFDQVGTTVYSGHFYVLYPIADVRIQRNIFYRCAKMTVGTSGTRKVSIKENLFVEQADVAVENWISSGTSQTLVQSNAFLSNNRIVLRIPPGMLEAKIIATNNFWNTLEVSVINQLIYDRSDDPGSDSYIPFVPFLSNQPSGIPAIPDPQINTQPQDLTANLGESVAYSVSASGFGILKYQWFFNEATLLNQTNATMPLSNLAPSQAGNYKVVVVNFAGVSVTSEVATLTVRVPPSIVIHPESRSVLAGGSSTFNVGVSEATVTTNVFAEFFGGGPVLTNHHPVAQSANLAVIDYQFYTVPDLMRIYLGDSLIYDNGLRSGTGTIQLGFGPGTSTELAIAMNEDGGANNSVWQYVITIVSGLLNFQWQKNGVDIPGATNWVHTITNTQPSDAAAYSVRVGNAAGSVDSNPADLVVCTAPLLVSPVFSTNGVFSMTIQAEAGCPCQVEKTINLTQQSWVPIALLPNITGQVQFSETNTPTGTAAFYRVRPVP